MRCLATADSVLAAKIGHGNPGLMLFQDANNLVFDKSAALHLWSFWLGQSLTQSGLDAGGNFKTCLINPERFVTDAHDDL
jgi:hypothetical protein